MIVACQATINQRVQALRLLLCEPEDALKESDDNIIYKLRFQKVFSQLFSLCSTDILRAIEDSGYSMTINETYTTEEQESIRISAQETAETFTQEIFLSKEKT